MSRAVVFVIAALVAISWIVASTMDMAMASNDERFYCEQVAVYIETNGAAGWPAYRGDELCQ